ncbi:MAG: hypothetical protein HOP12_09815 [Candidatus Eisenbacteria bacterium]|uniref:Uncharacterized protein n=1 Tax=Eiseniibacteriota bacterium TaxID=2212470 RepID=A0A849SL46_UNCEI|nr:hypothetical protein [Candidatus Eisenbacteria bacterium]
MTTTRRISWIAILLLGAVGCEQQAASLNRLAPATASENAQARTAGGDCDGLPTAPESQRVDLYTPAFPHPTRVTNPLFPIARLDRVLMLGNSHGEALRVETTLLARNRIIELGNGRRVEALVSQYMSWVDGRIHEVALDWYTQDDKGAVWYLGEDVFNYESGRIADRNGTWLAGRDGPAAMIMPASPRVGDVWRPENICGFVFEEVIATEIGVTVPGPRGPVPGALRVRELHMDGTFEDKTFAPGYGEFSTGSGANLEAVALAVPIDARSGPAPNELKSMSRQAAKIFRAARARRWDAASDALEDLIEAWERLEAHGVPASLVAPTDAALEALSESVEARNAAGARQASIDAARATLDLRLVYRPRAEIDLAHLELWGLQLVVDAEARDRDAIRGDLASIRWIRSRFTRPNQGDVDRRLDDLESSADSGDPDATNARAEQLSASLARIGVSEADASFR